MTRIRQRIFRRRLKILLFWFVFGFIVGAGFVWFVGQGIQNNRSYNRHGCAVYGYQEDCVTPLVVNQKYGQ